MRRIMLLSVLACVLGVATASNAYAATERVGKQTMTNGASPTTAGGCTSTPYTTTCVSVVGQGMYIASITGQVNVNVSGFYGHIQLHGPSINRSGANQIVGDGHTFSYGYSPNRYVNAGSYCATAWQWMGGGSYRNDGTACEYVS